MRKRKVDYRDNIVRFGLFYLVMILIGLLTWTYARASDYHQDGQGHRITYTITDSSGNPVSGQTVRVSIMRSSDEAFYDWSDGTFKFSGWTTKNATMPYQPTGEFYSRVLTIDVTATTPLISGDYVCIISNDNATYGDQQAEAVAFDSLSQLVKMHR